VGFARRPHRFCPHLPKQASIFARLCHADLAAPVKLLSPLMASHHHAITPPATMFMGWRPGSSLFVVRNISSRLSAAVSYPPPVKEQKRKGRSDHHGQAKFPARLLLGLRGFRLASNREELRRLRSALFARSTPERGPCSILVIARRNREKACMAILGNSTFAGCAPDHTDHHVSRLARAEVELRPAAF